MNTLADRLKWARGVTNLSARGLAKLAGLASERHIGLIEEGQRDNPELKTLKAISSTLGVSVGWLADGEEPAPSADDIRRAVAEAQEQQGAA